MFLEILLSCLSGAACVCVLILVWRKHATSGTLKIDCSDPGKDIYRLEVDDLDNLSRKRFIILRVDNKADLSHE